MNDLTKRLAALEAKAGNGQADDMESFLARHDAMIRDGRIVRDGATVYASNPKDAEAVEMARLHTKALEGLAEWEAELMRDK